MAANNDVAERAGAAYEADRNAEGADIVLNHFFQNWNAHTVDGTVGIDAATQTFDAVLESDALSPQEERALFDELVDKQTHRTRSISTGDDHGLSRIARSLVPWMLNKTDRFYDDAAVDVMLHAAIRTAQALGPLVTAAGRSTARHHHDRLPAIVDAFNAQAQLADFLSASAILLRDLPDDPRSKTQASSLGQLTDQANRDLTWTAGILKTELENVTSGFAALIDEHGGADSDQLQGISSALARTLLDTVDAVVTKTALEPASTFSR